MAAEVGADFIDISNCTCRCRVTQQAYKLTFGIPCLKVKFPTTGLSFWEWEKKMGNLRISPLPLVCSIAQSLANLKEICGTTSDVQKKGKGELGPSPPD